MLLPLPQKRIRRADEADPRAELVRRLQNTSVQARPEGHRRGWLDWNETLGRGGGPVDRKLVSMADKITAKAGLT